MRKYDDVGDRQCMGSVGNTDLGFKALMAEVPDTERKMRDGARLAGDLQRLQS